MRRADDLGVDHDGPGLQLTPAPSPPSGGSGSSTSAPWMPSDVRGVRARHCVQPRRPGRRRFRAPALWAGMRTLPLGFSGRCRPGPPGHRAGGTPSREDRNRRRFDSNSSGINRFGVHASTAVPASADRPTTGASRLGGRRTSHQRPLGGTGRPMSPPLQRGPSRNSAGADGHRETRRGRQALSAHPGEAARRLNSSGRFRTTMLGHHPWRNCGGGEPNESGDRRYGRRKARQAP
jgi:hypothetical protein